MTSHSDLLLPGQPVPLPHGPPPKIGEGLYSRDDIVRASVLGTPQRDGPVRAILTFLPSVTMNVLFISGPCDSKT